MLRNSANYHVSENPNLKEPSKAKAIKIMKIKGTQRGAQDNTENIGRSHKVKENKGDTTQDNTEKGGKSQRDNENKGDPEVASPKTIEKRDRSHKDNENKGGAEGA